VYYDSVLVGRPLTRLGGVEWGLGKERKSNNEYDLRALGYNNEGISEMLVSVSVSTVT
jgi:hypothetical protein